MEFAAYRAMKLFKCRDAGMDCDWEVRSEDEKEIVSRALEHGREHHGIKEPHKGLVDKIRSKIRDVRAA
jgi:predicted small metal-binding protein